MSISPGPGPEPEVLPALGTRAARGGGMLVLRHGLGLGLNALGGLVLARAFGPAVLGLYFAAATYFTVARQLVDFGVTPHCIRVPAERAPYADAFWLQQILAAGVVTVTLACLLAGLPERWAPAHARLLALFALGAAVGAAAWAWQAIPAARLERRLDYARIGLVEVLEPLTFNLVAVGIGLATQRAEGLALALALRGWVPAVAAQWLAPSRRPGRPAAVAALARELAPLVAAQATLWLILMAPPILLGRLAGAEALGHAQFAYSLLGSAGVLALVVQRVVFAALARLQGDPRRFAATVDRAVALLACVYVPVVFAIVAFAGLWVPAACGASWQPMVRVLHVAAIPVAGAGLLSIFYGAVLAHGQLGLVLKQNLVHAALYATALAGLARPLEGVAQPVAHLLALPAGILYLRAYGRAHGPPRGRPALAALAASGILLVGTAPAVASGGRPAVMAAGAWALFLGACAVWAWRRLEVGALLRRARAGGPLGLPGV